jgi:hypothetical protein
MTTNPRLPILQEENSMSRPTLERRVAELERQLAELLSRGEGASPTSWRETVGMFSNDPLMKEIDAAGQAWREADRSKARKRRAPATKLMP